MPYKVEAICPKCRENHIVIIQGEWKGNGILRRYCQTCRRKKDLQQYMKVIPLRGVTFAR